MNERIKQLALQSGAKLCHAYTPHPNGKNHVWTPDAGLDLAHMDAEEFAELIVEECRYVMDCNKGSDQHTEWNRALSETSDKIKQHFGVE